MLIVSYDPVLVAASILVAIMASYTGLRLASGLSQFAAATRKREIAKAAVALGGGIWSMHFVGMLAVQLPVSIQYDALATLGSVLVAILVTGLGLLVLHFGHRTRKRILIAGILTGVGIVSMHYIGMSAIGGNCIVTYEPSGYLVSTAIAVAASTAALWLAYRRRSLPQIALGAVLLGVTIAAMHYSAMVYTRFSLATELELIEEPTLSSGALALVVAFAAFLICGLFLLTAIPVSRPEEERARLRLAPRPAGGLGGAAAGVSAAAGAAAGGAALAMPATALNSGPLVERAPEHGSRNGVAGGGPQQARASVPASAEYPARGQPATRLPYEANHATRFIAVEAVQAVRADGHYTRLYNDGGEVFCPWPISRVAAQLDRRAFIRTHRSYLVNLRHVQGFERDGDKAFCLVGERPDKRVPVSRSRVQEVRRALGLD